MSRYGALSRPVSPSRRDPWFWQADFRTLTPGIGASNIQGVTVARAAGGIVTVRTGLSRVNSNAAAGIGANLPRIYSNGNGVGGLLLEESRTRVPFDARDFSVGVSWFGGIGSYGATTGYARSTIDGSAGSTGKETVAIAQYGPNNRHASLPTGPRTCSLWAAQNGGAAYNQIISYDGTNIVASMYPLLPGNAWTYASITQAAVATGGQFEVCDARDQTASGGGNPGAMTNSLDMAFVEAGGFATSTILGGDGVAGTRAADLAQTTTDLRSSGALKLEFALRPLGGSSQYASDQELWSIDANNNAVVTQSTRKITITIGGVPVTLGTAIPAFSAFDRVLPYVEAGGGIPTHAWVTINGVLTDLGSGAALGNVPSGTLYLLNNGTAGVMSAVVPYIRAYA